MISVQNVRKVYPTNPDYPVLRGVSLGIRAGEFVSIIGTSGSGKSTLLNIIGGLDNHYDGMVSVDNLELKTLRDPDLSHFRNRKIGFVFQAFNLLNHLNCSENVRLPSYFMSNLSVEELNKRTQACLEAVGLTKKAHQKPLTLSGGERQRVAIARALFNEPKILLCDEPTGSLDSKTGDKILDLFESLNRESGITLIIVTHDIRVSERAGRLIRIEDGRIASDTALSHAAEGR